jgi:hypothetical protein
MRWAFGTSRAESTLRRRSNRRPQIETFEDRILLNSTILFDPTGGSGGNSNSVLQATSFTWGPGTVDLVGGGAITSASVGHDVTFLYQTFATGIATPFGGPQPTVATNNGDISIAGFGDTGKQIVLTVQFTEKVAAGSVAGAYTFTPDLSVGTNAVKIYDQSANDPHSANIDPTLPNNAAGAGWPGSGNPVPSNSTLILSGHVLDDATFTSSFIQSTITPLGALNINADTNNFSYPGIKSILGTGNTAFDVMVDTTNPAYFLNPGLVSGILSFSQGVEQGTPFNVSQPAEKMFTGAAPTVGATNGVNGPDAIFQGQTANNFTLTGTPTPTPTPTPASRGDSATIGFWHNKNGQAIINGLGTNTVDGPTETAGQWINAHFHCLLALWTSPSLPGSPTIAQVTTGNQNTDNTNLAAAYANVFQNGGSPKVLAQIFDTLLTMYATSTTLNHTNGDTALASNFGFNISAGGTGSHTVTIPNSVVMDAFGSSAPTPVSPNTYTILSIVQAANTLCMQPGFTGFSSAVNDIFDNDINSAFDI